MNLRTQLHNIRYTDGKDLQEQLTKIEEIFIEIARLNDSVTEKDKIVALLRSLPGTFSFIALMADATK